MDHGFIDEYVGRRLREKRILSGLSQSQLAEQIDVTFQQLQKYERGKNRISASRLFGCSVALNEPVSYFFHGLPGQPIVDESLALPVDAEDESAFSDRETLEIIRIFYSIKNPELKQSLKALIRAIAHHTE